MKQDFTYASPKIAQKVTPLHAESKLVNVHLNINIA